MNAFSRKAYVQRMAQKRANNTGIAMAVFSRPVLLSPLGEHREWAFCPNVDLVSQDWRFETFICPEVTT